MFGHDIQNSLLKVKVGKFRKEGNFRNFKILGYLLTKRDEAII